MNALVLSIVLLDAVLSYMIVVHFNITVLVYILFKVLSQLAESSSTNATVESKLKPKEDDPCDKTVKPGDKKVGVFIFNGLLDSKCYSTDNKADNDREHEHGKEYHTIIGRR